MILFKIKSKTIIRKTLKKITIYEYMIEKSIFFIWFIWYIYNYGPPPILFNLLFKIYHNYNDFFINYNKLIYPTFWENDNEKTKTDLIEVKTENEKIQKPKKYEDKYLDDIRKLSKEWVFTEEENIQIPQLIQDFLNGSIETRQNRIEEINIEIDKLNNEIDEDSDIINYIEALDSEGDELIRENTLEERNELRNKQISMLQEELQTLKNLIETDEGIQNLKIESQNQAESFIINKRLDKLNNCYIIEKTPIGNVLMIYKKDSESFQYYSDCNIPYRYLEVVGRKYIKFFNCRPIFVDMEEELKLFEEKWEKEQESKKIKEEQEEKRKADKNQQPIQAKKNVFAKFKSYNKDAGGKISMAAPPKNSIPNKLVNETKENEKILLKERANRYTYEGKFVNFNFLQKIERKMFNKRLGLSFADFKKMSKK